MTTQRLRDVNIIVYDLEIEKEVKDVEGGWDNPEAMGVSIACAYHYGQAAYRFYCRDSERDNMNALAGMLSSADLVVGFNQVSFDSRVLNGVGAPYTARFEMDLLRLILETWWQLDVPAKDEPWPANYPAKQQYFAGWGLDEIAQATINLGKTGHGADAPKKWKAGMLADVINYCRDDVMLARFLFEHILKHRWVKNAKGEQVELDLEAWEADFGWMARSTATDKVQSVDQLHNVGRNEPQNKVTKATHWHTKLRKKVCVVGEQGGCMLIRPDLGGGRLGAKVESLEKDLIPIDQPLGPARHIKKMDPHPLTLQQDAAKAGGEE